MLRNRELAKLHICRQCLNSYSQIRFKNYELKYKYYYYHFKCTKCGSMHHIVKAVKPQYSWKLLFVRNHDDIKPIDDPAVEKALKCRQLKIKFKRWFNL